MADSLDYIGSCYLNPAASSLAVLPALPEACLPLLPGSGSNLSPNQTPEYLAGDGGFEPANWLQGLTVPAFQIRTRIYTAPTSTTVSNWFTIKYLQRFLGLTANDRSATTGILANIGPIRWKYGSEITLFNNCLLDRMTIQWSGVGGTAEANLLFLAYGAPVDPDVPPVGFASYGRHIQPQGITLTSSTGVRGGSISFSNGLTPDDSTPNAAQGAGSGLTVPFAGHFITPALYNSPLIGSVMLRAKLGSAFVLPTALVPATEVFTFTDGTTSRTLTIGLALPNKTESNEVGRIATVSRTYPVVKSGTGAAPVASVAVG